MLIVACYLVCVVSVPSSKLLCHGKLQNIHLLLHAGRSRYPVLELSPLPRSVNPILHPLVPTTMLRLPWLPS